MHLLALALGLLLLAEDALDRFDVPALGPCFPAEFSVCKDSIMGVAARASAKRPLLLRAWLDQSAT